MRARTWRYIESLENRVHVTILKVIALTTQRDEWRQQHENLLSVRETDNKNLSERISVVDRENAELKQKLDRYTRMSESGETLGDHLDLVESHTELERENAELRKQLEQAKAEQRKTDALYFAVNDMMAHLGAYGEIDPTGDIADAVMNALFDIDGGNAIERGE